MKINYLFLTGFLLVIILKSSCFELKAQTAGTDQDIFIMRKVADNILSNTTYDFIIPDDGTVIKDVNTSNYKESILIRSPYNSWRYWNGVLNIAMLRIAENLNEKKYQDFAVKNYEFAFDNLPFFKKNYKDQSKWSYPFAQSILTEELDDCGAMGGGLIEVNQIKPRKDYVEYINIAASHMLNIQDRLEDRTYVRKLPHKMTLWADDLYMSIVFLSRMGKWSGENKYFDDAILQVENFTRYLYNPKTELYYHAWYNDLKTNGVAHWGRCNGWVMMAQVELLDNLPENYPGREQLLKILFQQIQGIARYQNVTGLWHQLIDKNDSYLETSSSAMFTYSIAKAVNKGWIDKRYISIALTGWEGVKTNIQEDGQVKNICMGTGIENDLLFYYNRPTPLNDIHGLGAILLAGNEIVKYKKANPSANE
jgi:unsaturated rhamnogalacturonyl hydrolase